MPTTWSFEMANIKFPSICDVAYALRAVRESMDEGQTDLDVRLQVYRSCVWAIRIGDSGYDADHLGYWGASSIDQKTSIKTIASIAKDLLEQAKEAYSCR
jgi:dihydroxyacetone kinase